MICIHNLLAINIGDKSIPQDMDICKDCSDRDWVESHISEDII